jgi:hypothetical protein
MPSVLSVAFRGGAFKFLITRKIQILFPPLRIRSPKRVAGATGADKDILTGGLFLGNRQRKIRRPQSKKPAGSKTVTEIVRELKENAADSSDYREQSLKIHGLICAKCGREFEYKDRRLLTVHHKDGNRRNNPTDGSNWENLCVDCHEDEHSRGLLGDYLKGNG